MQRPNMRRAPNPLLTGSLLLLLLSPAPLAKRPAPDLGGRTTSGSDWRLRLLLLREEHASVWVSPPRLPVLGAGAAALLVRPLQRLGPRGELLHRRPADLSGRLKRHTPPLSIDLTFLLLRQMMEISRAQSQQAQAKQNRLLLDSVGK